MDIRPIRTEEDLTAALKRIDALWGAPEGTDEGDELDVLATLVEHYEARHWPIERSNPVAVIRFFMEQNDYTQKDLGDVLGSRPRASEILSGKRTLTLDHIKALHAKWRIPSDLLIGEMTDA